MAEHSVQWARVIEEKSKDPTFAKEHQGWLQNSTFEDTQKQFRDAKTQHENSSTGYKAIEKMEPLLEGFDRFGGFAAEMATLEPHGIGSLCVGSLRIVVTGILTTKHDFDEIVSGFDEVHGELHRLTSHENRFAAKPFKGLNVALYKVFNAYWAFFQDVYSLLYSKKRHKPRGLISQLKDSLTGKMQKIKGNIPVIHQLCDITYKEINLASELKRDHAESQVQQTIDNIEAQMSEQRKHDFREDCRSFKDRIRSVDADVEKAMNRLLGQQLLETGEWLFQEPAYQAWVSGDVGKDTRTASVLWLSAGPGFGKSTLMAFLTNHLRRTYPTGIAYFAFDSGVSDRGSVQALLRTVLYQLVLEDKITGESHFIITPSTISIANRNGGEPNMESLLDILREKAREDGKTTMIIIDALDECPKTADTEEEMEQLFSLIEELAPNWRFLFTSRRNPWFEQILEESSLWEKLSRLTLTKKHNERDIGAYIIHELDSLMETKECKKNWTDDFRYDVEKEIFNASEGMFKWTYLVLNKLKKSRQLQSDMEKARKAIDEVPGEVKDIYKRTMLGLEKIEDDATKEEMIRALRWILRSYRPFTVSELGAALALQYDLSEDGLQERLEEYIGDLLYIDPKTQAINLTHTSARDYLTAVPRFKSQDGSQPIPDQLAEIDLDILRACLSFLSDPDRPFLEANPANHETEKTFNNVLKGYGFWEYASIGLIYHLSEICGAQIWNEDLEAEFSAFLTSDEHTVILKWLQVFSFVRSKNRTGAAQAYSIVLDTLMNVEPAVSNPMSDLLCKKYPDFNRHFGWSDGGRFIRWQRFLGTNQPACSSATLLAAFFDFRSALDLLDVSEEPLHYKGHSLPSALYWAAAGDSKDSLGLLLSEKYNERFPAHRDAADGRSRKSSPLLEAVCVPRNILSRPGTYPAATMLLDDGCRISWGFEAALFDSVPDSEGTAQLVNRILKIPRAFTFKDDSVGPVMNYAAFTGLSKVLLAFSHHQALLKNLIAGNTPPGILEAYEKESAPRSRYWNQLALIYWRGMAAVHFAAVNNDAASVRLLCPDAQNSSCECELNDWRPLHLAAQRSLQVYKHQRQRHLDEWITITQPIEPSSHVVFALAEANVDPRHLDSAGNLAIHLAAYSGCDEVIYKLTRAIYETDVPNKAGKTPLQITLEIGYITAAQSLLHEGAALDKVPDALRQQFVFHNRDNPKEIKIERVTPLWIKIVIWTRRMAKKPIPIPIIARIIKFMEYNEVYETFEVERRDHYIFTELTSDISYLQSLPIPKSSSSSSVRRIKLTARSYRQNFTGHKWEKTWSWLRTEKIEAGSGRMVPWHAQSIFRWNYMEPTEETVEYAAYNPKDAPYLRALKISDRICIVPTPTYPAWEANIEWARIRIDMWMLRDCFSSQERRRIWAMPRRPVSNSKVQERFKEYFTGKRMVECIRGRIADDGTAGSKAEKMALR